MFFLLLLLFYTLFLIIGSRVILSKNASQIISEPYPKPRIAISLTVKVHKLAYKNLHNLHLNHLSDLNFDYSPSRSCLATLFSSMVFKHTKHFSIQGQLKVLFLLLGLPHGFPCNIPCIHFVPSSRPPIPFNTPHILDGKGFNLPCSPSGT